MDQVELPPLRGREWAEDGMVEKFAARTQIFFATRHDVIHLGDLETNLGPHLLGWQAAGTSYWRGLAARGAIAKSHDNESTPALRPGLGRRQRLSGFDHALKSLDRSGVG